MDLPVNLLMFAVGLILLITGAILGATVQSEAEHFAFLSYTVQLGDLAVEPIRIDTPNPLPPTTDFVNVLSNVVPMVRSKPDAVPEVFIAPKTLVYNTNNLRIYQNTPVRFITNLYTTYLNIIVRADDDTVQPITTLQDALNQSLRLKVVYTDDTLLPIAELMFPRKNVRGYEQYTYTDFLRQKELAKGAIYFLWTHEQDPYLKTLGTRTKLRIVDVDQEVPGILAKYPSLQRKGYDVQTQGATNKRPLVTTYADKVAIWGFDSLPKNARNNQRIYQFTRTLFQHIEYIRRNVLPEYRNLFLELRPDTMVEIPLVPYHDGVVRYFHEMGAYSYS